MFSIRRLLGSLLAGSAALLMAVGQAGAVPVDPALLDHAMDAVQQGSEAAVDRIAHQDGPIVVDEALATALSVLDDLVADGVADGATAEAVLAALQTSVPAESEGAAFGLAQAFTAIQTRGEDIAAEHRPDDPQPADPDRPDQPADPDRPDQPADPDRPDQPADPDRPEDPSATRPTVTTPEPPTRPTRPADSEG